MFKNVQISFSQAESIQLRWDWDNTGDTMPPKCNVFYCGVPENKLLVRGVFTEREVLNYFHENVVRIFDTNARQELLNYNTRNADTSRLNVFQQSGHHQENKQLVVPPGTNHYVFLVCIFDENDMVFRVVAHSGERVEFEIEKPGLMQKLRGTTCQTIRLKGADSRKKVLVTRSNGKNVYSVLPDGYEKLHFPKELDISGINIYYLSSLIGMDNSGED